jgi:hypothetical protein
MSHYARTARAQALPPPAPSGPTIYSVPRPSGGYEYWEAPPGLGVPLNDDFPVPTVAHPNPIGVSILTLGRPLPPGSRKVGEGSVARGSITPMPGVRRDGPLTSGLGNDAALGASLGALGFADTTDAELQTAKRASAVALGVTALVAGLVVWKASR